MQKRCLIEGRDNTTLKATLLTLTLKMGELEGRLRLSLSLIVDDRKGTRRRRRRSRRKKAWRRTKSRSSSRVLPTFCTSAETRGKRRVKIINELNFIVSLDRFLGKNPAVSVHWVIHSPREAKMSRFQRSSSFAPLHTKHCSKLAK